MRKKEKAIEEKEI